MAFSTKASSAPQVLSLFRQRYRSDRAKTDSLLPAIAPGSRVSVRSNGYVNTRFHDYDAHHDVHGIAKHRLVQWFRRVRWYLPSLFLCSFVRCRFRFVGYGQVCSFCIVYLSVFGGCCDPGYLFLSFYSTLYVCLRRFAAALFFGILRWRQCFVIYSMLCSFDSNPNRYLKSKLNSRIQPFILKIPHCL